MRGNTGEFDYIPVKAFKAQAEKLGAMVKGAYVEIEGSVQSGSYEKDGQKVYTLDVIAWGVSAGDSKPDQADADPNSDLPFSEQPHE